MNQHSKTYAQKTADDYIQQMSPDVRSQLEPSQLEEIRRLLDVAIPKPSPKIVDLRFTIDLLFSRFYIVLFVGKDRRRQPRPNSPLRPIQYAGNLIAVIFLLISFNLTISASLFLGAYLLKSALNINFLPGHFPERMLQERR